MTPQEEIRQYFKVCGFAPEDTVSVVWKGRSGSLGWTTVTVEAAHKPILGHMLVDCWISANPMRPPTSPESRGSSEDVYAVRSLWADLDVGPGKMPNFDAARKVIAKVSEIIGAQPVVLVASGHGLQPRWRLTQDFLSMEEWAALLERFGRLVQKVAVEFGGKADSVHDLPRILRAPGTANCKDGVSKSIKVQVKFTGSTGTVEPQGLKAVLDEQMPVVAPEPVMAKAADVDLTRGNAYTKSVIAYIRKELAEIKDWKLGQTDDRGRGWEKIQADAAYRLAELAKADWNQLSEATAQTIFSKACPVDGNWTARDVVKKWKAQWPRASAAEPPAVVDDPLAPGFGADAAPHRPAADQAATGRRAADHADGDGAHAADRARPADRVVPSPPRPEAGPVAGGGAAAGDGIPWRRYAWTDRGNAKRIIALFGDELRWSPGLKRWLRYSDGAWREDETGGETAALQMIDQIRNLEAGFYSDEDVQVGRGKVSNERADFLKWAREQEAAAKCAAAAKSVRYTQELNAEASCFDNEPMLLNAPNGIVDLRTGELLAHDPSLMLRRQVPIPFDPHAKAPRWDAFLERVMPSADMRDYLQRVIGYTLTGRTTEQVVFFHVGPPATGKSVFLRIMESILGEFSRIVPPTTLLNKKMEQHPTDVMGMEGRRMLQVSETPEGARLDEALVKRLSGEETITARGMGQDFRDFRIVGKVHLVTNHDPHISDDPAVHRRLHYIPWQVQIPVEQRDPMLAVDIISEELVGVLAWAVRGALRWGADRLERPMEAEMARATYIESEDEFGQFIEEELILGAESFTTSREVFRRYTQWADSLRIKPMSSIALGRKLSARGVEAARTTHARGWKVALTQVQWSPPDPLA